MLVGFEVSHLVAAPGYAQLWFYASETNVVAQSSGRKTSIYVTVAGPKTDKKTCFSCFLLL